MSRAQWVLIGTDPRLRIAADRLKAGGGLVVLHEQDHWSPDTDRLITESRPNRLVLPFRPMPGLPADGVLELAGDIYAGQLDEGWKGALGKAGKDPLLYLNEERFVWENAGLTAEGFLASWYSGGGGSVRGKEFHIAGYGRVGKALARLLGPAGARVAVMARSPAAVAEANQEGFAVCPLTAGMKSVMPAVLINTIPSRWLDPEGPVRPGRILDLASSPGCLAPGRRHEYYELLPALPGKWFPEDAARLLADALCRIDGERKGRNDA